jgi:gas vesicle protein
VRDGTAVLIGLVAGAVVGGVAGWLWLSDEGRQVRARLEPQLKDLAGQAMALRDSAARFQAAARGSAQAAQDVAARSARH